MAILVSLVLVAVVLFTHNYRTIQTDRNQMECSIAINSVIYQSVAFLFLVRKIARPYIQHINGSISLGLAVSRATYMEQMPSECLRKTWIQPRNAIRSRISEWQRNENVRTTCNEECQEQQNKTKLLLIFLACFNERAWSRLKRNVARMSMMANNIGAYGQHQILNEEVAAFLSHRNGLPFDKCNCCVPSLVCHNSSFTLNFFDYKCLPHSKRLTLQYCYSKCSIRAVGAS